MELFDFVGSALSGGLLGVLGAGMKVVGEYFANKQKMEMQRIANDHEIALIDKQSQMKVIEGEIEARIVRDKADGDIKSKSYEVYTDLSNVYKWVASVIALNRVILTWLLWMLTAWIAYKVMDMRGTSIIDGKDVMAQIVNNVTFCAAAATTWWFGDRPPQKR